EEYEREAGSIVDPLTSYAELTKKLFEKTDEYYDDNDWGYTIFITDLPIYHNDHLTVVDINESTEGDVISLPAYDCVTAMKGILDTIVTLIMSIQGDNDRQAGNREEADREALLGTFNRYFRTNRLNYVREYIEYTGSEHSIYQMKDNVRGYLRVI